MYVKERLAGGTGTRQAGTNGESYPLARAAHNERETGPAAGPVHDMGTNDSSSLSMRKWETVYAKCATMILAMKPTYATTPRPAAVANRPGKLQQRR